MEQYVIIIEAQGWPVGTDTGVAAEWGPGESRWARAHPFSSWIEGKEGGDQGRLGHLEQLDGTLGKLKEMAILSLIC